MKIRKYISGLLTALVGIYVVILLFPQMLFANSIDYKNFKVYYHQDDLNIEALKSVLDASEVLLSDSHLYNTSHKQEVFLSDSFKEFTFFSLVSRKAFAVNYPITQHIFLSETDVLKNQIIRNSETYNKRKLSAVIAHETVHSYLENELGLLKYKLLPSWKNEGYCDFIAKESSYNETLGREELCSNSQEPKSPSFTYFKYRMLTEYLLKDKKVELDSFLENTFDLNQLESEYKSKHCE